MLKSKTSEIYKFQDYTCTPDHQAADSSTFPVAAAKPFTAAASGEESMVSSFLAAKPVTPPQPFNSAFVEEPQSFKFPPATSELQVKKPMRRRFPSN